ncbi:hypothetical protein FKM82_018417 [Ascaphus truei]
MAAEASVITRVKPFSRSVEWRMRSRPAPRRACALCLFSRSPFRSGQWTLHSSVSVAVVTISGFQKQRGPLFSTEEAGDPGPPGLQVLCMDHFGDIFQSFSFICTMFHFHSS